MQEEKGATEDEMFGWHHRLNGHEFEQAPAVDDGQGSLACCSLWGRKKLDTTERLKWTELVFLPRECHGQRSLECYNPRGHEESDMTEHTHRGVLIPETIVFSNILYYILLKNATENLENLSPSFLLQLTQLKKKREAVNHERIPATVCFP